MHDSQTLLFCTRSIPAMRDVTFYLTAHLSALPAFVSHHPCSVQTCKPFTCPLKWKHPERRFSPTVDAVCYLICWFFLLPKAKAFAQESVTVCASKQKSSKSCGTVTDLASKAALTLHLSVLDSTDAWRLFHPESDCMSRWDDGSAVFPY